MGVPGAALPRTPKAFDVLHKNATAYLLNIRELRAIKALMGKHVSPSFIGDQTTLTLAPNDGFNPSILAAWREQVAQATGLEPQVADRQSELLPL